MTDRGTTPVSDPRRGGHIADTNDRYYLASRPELRRLVPSGARRALDVGCGIGNLGAALREEAGIEAHGLELYPDAAAEARARLDSVVEGDLDHLTELPFPDGYFDCMLFGDVLEHLHDPTRALGMLSRYLADDGTLICSIPNVGHWSVLTMLLGHGRWQYEERGLLDRTHVTFFTLAEIIEMLESTGFELDTLEATQVGDSPAVEPLVACAAALGARPDRMRRQLLAYQYILRAHRTGSP
ncbi:Methyltransferase domain-containing protein [Gaiella occulta]|uniref:Methyltransferase domain-containing protein n=1 Tax=Gaiella occulta TaxID=1002870 RepID=A0A7M2Z0S1_9ACTN|nr:class I SAM-dependent methyltransferase [Gaiella occulta]RDI76008.1 Methyltransferase domain-containing protein [Gaiella occulta]